GRVSRRTARYTKEAPMSEPEIIVPLDSLEREVLRKDRDREPPQDATITPVIVPVANDKIPKDLEPGLEA
ncbi:MAG TPA: hypothetical protein VMM92_12845, partial [Thermoanaerobaculia bacterium]|nr:hypothetical protein [Thermoanaerobaculia bacterium]